MKNKYYTLLALCMILAVFVSFETINHEANALPVKELVRERQVFAEEAPVTQVTTSKQISAFRTLNNKDIFVVTTTPQTAIDGDVALRVLQNDIVIPVTAAANMPWQYIIIDSFAVIPKTNAEFNSAETSVYNNGQQLYIAFEQNAPRTLYLVTTGLSVPTFIAADTAVTKTKLGQNLIEITGQEPLHELSIYWATIDKPIDVIEDTRREEVEAHEIARATIYLEELTGKIQRYDTLLAQLQNDDQVLHETLITGEEFGAFVAAQKAQQENRITANITLAEPTLVYWGILTLIIMIVIIDSLVMHKRREYHGTQV